MLKISRWMLVLLRTVLISLFFITPLSAIAAVNNTLKVITFNILAPCWASPSYYPTKALPYLPRELRRAKIIAFLKNNPTADVFTLAEVTKVEFDYIKDALSNNYVGFQSFHAPTYWSNWITIDPPWEPNGNAMFLKKGVFTNIQFSDISLSDDGNHATYAEAIHKSTNKKLRIASVHLDSDHSYNREREFNALLSFMPFLENTTDIIAGDFNVDIERATLQQDILKAGFTNILAALGNHELTSPYSSTYYKRAVWGVIDVVLARNAVPLDGNVFSFGLYQQYPNDEDSRIATNMNICGSDHFPVGATVQINK